MSREVLMKVIFRIVMTSCKRSPKKEVALKCAAYALFCWAIWSVFWNTPSPFFVHLRRSVIVFFSVCYRVWISVAEFLTLI